MKKLATASILLLVIFGILLSLNSTQAFSLMDNVSPVCKDKGDCNVCDILRVFYNAGIFIFASMAGVALLMIIWAATSMIMNWGNAESVSKNRKLILHTLLGVVIILMAWTLVNAIGWGFLKAANPAGREFWSDGWWNGPKCD